VARSGQHGLDHGLRSSGRVGFHDIDNAVAKTPLSVRQAARSADATKPWAHFRGLPANHRILPQASGNGDSQLATPGGSHRVRFHGANPPITTPTGLAGRHRPIGRAVRGEYLDRDLGSSNQRRPSPPTCPLCPMRHEAFPAGSGRPFSRLPSGAVNSGNPAVRRISARSA